MRPELRAVPVAAAFLTGADDLKFLISLFDEILLSWNMFSEFSEKAGICCPRLGMHLADRNQNLTQPQTGGRQTAPPYLSRILLVSAYAFNSLYDTRTKERFLSNSGQISKDCIRRTTLRGTCIKNYDSAYAAGCGGVFVNEQALRSIISGRPPRGNPVECWRLRFPRTIN